MSPRKPKQKEQPLEQEGTQQEAQSLRQGGVEVVFHENKKKPNTYHMEVNQEQTELRKEKEEIYARGWEQLLQLEQFIELRTSKIHKLKESKKLLDSLKEEHARRSQDFSTYTAHNLDTEEKITDLKIIFTRRGKELWQKLVEVDKEVKEIEAKEKILKKEVDRLNIPHDSQVETDEYFKKIYE